MDEIENTFIGINIAKDELVVHVLPTNTQLIVPNSIKGFRQLVKLLKDHPPQQILCEATGSLERLLVAEGLPIVIVNPRQARDLAKRLGQLAKTDAVDAHILARIASMQVFTPRPLPPKEIRDMNDLVLRRQQLGGVHSSIDAFCYNCYISQWNSPKSITNASDPFCRGRGATL